MYDQLKMCHSLEHMEWKLCFIRERFMLSLDENVALDLIALANA